MFKNLNPKTLGVSGFQSEIIELALSNGFRGMDIDVVEVSDQVKSNGIESARRFIDSAKIKIGCGRLPVTWQDDDETFQGQLAELGPFAEALKAIGCSRLTTSIEPATDERPYHEHFEFHRQRFAEICRTLALHDIRLGLAFSGADTARQEKQFEFVHDLDALLSLLSTVAEPNVGVVLDLWDVYASGGDLSSLDKVSAEQIVTVRLSDAPADVPTAEWTEEESRLLPGATGAIDSVGALARLSAIGYEGPITPVAARAGFRGMTREAIVRQTGERLNAVWKEVGLTPAGRMTAAAQSV